MNLNLKFYGKDTRRQPCSQSHFRVIFIRGEETKLNVNDSSMPLKPCFLKVFLQRNEYKNYVLVKNV